MVTGGAIAGTGHCSGSCIVQLNLKWDSGAFSNWWASAKSNSL